MSCWDRIVKASVVALIYFFFGLYVWLFQLKYEEAEGFRKVSLFVLVILSGNLSYDAAKHLLSLDAPRFWTFFRHITRLALHVFLLFTFATISAVLFNQDTWEVKYVGFWVYLLALVQTYWIVHRLTEAVNSVSEADDDN